MTGSREALTYGTAIRSAFAYLFERRQAYNGIGALGARQLTLEADDDGRAPTIRRAGWRCRFFIQGIVALLGSSGKFVVLILLVLQLVASGGTFPWQTTPEPLHALHQILPMGHVVDGMRILIYGADLSRIVPIILGLVGYTLFGLLLSYLAARKHKFWTLKTLQPEIAV